jgi:plastocyanin
MVNETSALTTRATRPAGALLLRLFGAGLLLATGGIHLDLYLTGYRHIPTIGPLFLLQVIAAFVIAAAVLAIPRRIVALGAAGFAVSTLGGYILSLWVGLFGFNEVRTTAGIVAGAIEVATFVVLGAYAAWCAPETGPTSSATPALVLAGRRAVAPLGVLGVLSLVLAVSNASGTSGGSATVAAAPASRAGSIKVTIRNFAFSPAHFTVKPGERIVVTNKDSVTHTFTAMPGSAPVGHFDSGDIAPGKTETVTAPTSDGSYAFYCSIHPFMTGTVTVR